MKCGINNKITVVASSADDRDWDPLYANSCHVLIDQLIN